MLLQLAESKKMEGGVNSYTVSIPQAVSAVATINFCVVFLRFFRFVSIPQAVSAVATVWKNAMEATKTDVGFQYRKR